ncbi:MAG: restriction endonuclease subunit S [Sphingomonas sp.]|uniref:restriction endonuclease subunit S n=1 Tax=Sphingomonas sp. TaxID=28214 RepID=UPI001ACFE446|nr:restriction endonuclease subunit S [Sphingomonas sp.]MBN8850047.1 restriction endonuclease subunit S [Sphingomonas sp.]
MLGVLYDRLADLSELPDAHLHLRRLVLELAVQGAFVPGADTSPAPLVRVGDVSEILTGTSVNAAEKELRYAGLTDGFPYIATKDVALNSGVIDYENGVKIPCDEIGFKVAPAGSVLVCAEGGSAGKKIGLTDRPVCFGNKLYAIVPNDGLIPLYLNQVIRSNSFYEQFKSQITGIIGGVSIKKFKDILIPVPSLVEQQCTIDALSNLEGHLANLERCRLSEQLARMSAVDGALAALRDSADSASLKLVWERVSSRFGGWFTDLASLKRLRQAIIDVAVRGLLLDEDASLVKETTLSALTAFGPKNGFSPRPVSGPTPTKTMSLSAITKGIFDPTAFKYVQETPPQDSDLWVEPGDILLQRANTIEYVGVSAVYTGEIGDFIYPDLIMRITPKPGVDSRFLHLALSCSKARAFMRERASGTSGTMPKVNQATVKAVPVRLPSIEQQRRVVAATEELLSFCSTLERGIEARQRDGLALLEALARRPADGGPSAGGKDAGAIDEQEGQGNSTEAAVGSGFAQKTPSSAKPVDLGHKHDDDRVFEAVLVTAVVDAFFERSPEPLGNFRLQKAVYFARRRIGDTQVNSDYLKKVAGPYNPKMRYSGGIAVAKSQGWIREARGRFGFGHIRGANAEFAQSSLELRSVASWVRDTFVLRKNDEWERLATIDYATCALGKRNDAVTPKSVLDFIRNLDVWQHKVAKLGLNEFSIESAMLELSLLFPTDLRASARVLG